MNLRLKLAAVMFTAAAIAAPATARTPSTAL